MNNETLIVFHGLLLLLTSIIYLIALIKDRERAVTKKLMRLSLIVLGWQITVIAYFATTDPFWARFFYDAKLVFVAFAPIQLYFLSNNFYENKKVKQKILTNILLCVIPTITSVLALTSPLHTLIRQELTVLQINPVHVVKNVRGIWFWIHSFYSYSIMFLSALTVINRHRKLLKAYRTPSALLIAGILIAFISNVLFVFIIRNPFFIDITLVGLSVALLFLYIAINVNDQEGFLVIAREKVFNYLSDYIFILDNEHSVIDCNSSATNWLSQIDVNSSISSFNEIASKFTNLGFNALESISEESGLDVDMAVGTQIVSYNLRKPPIHDKYGKQVGFLAVFTDVTRYKILIDEQTKMAGIDPLTGLGNRRRFEQIKHALDIPANLPFSVIAGDANGLKTINDTLGHEMGDSFLRLIANVLSDACPEASSAYRIGGDEFMLLLPGISPERTNKIIDDVQNTFAKIERYPFKPSVALGSATKTRINENLDTVIKIADSAMYRNKETQRAGDTIINFDNL